MKTSTPRSQSSPPLNPLRKALALDGPWSFAWSEQPAEFRTIADVQKSGMDALPCQVPGNFELDLLANGRIKEPYVGMNIVALQRFESTHVWYYRRFDCTIPKGTEPVFVFEGLDCFADIYLNGILIGSTANALVEHVVSAKGLRSGSNEMLIHIRPSLDEARKYDYPPGAVAQLPGYGGMYVRKPPHAFGWDIMPRAVSGGIWRSVRLEFLPAARLETVWLETTAADESNADLTLHFRTRLPMGNISGYRIAIEGKCGKARFEAAGPVVFEAGRVTFSVANPKRWWPRDRGLPELYDVTVRLIKGDRECDRAVFRHGIRMVQLLRTSVTDESGSGEFCFLVNGERTFIRGTNWVPADTYHSRDAARIPRILELAKECGCNLIRCWGGNVFESREFFDFCDENGILVWQDFALACVVYPHNDELARIIEDEARKVVRRLRQHASLALWSGDNECDLAHDWHQRGSPEGNRLTRIVLPRVLSDEDPSRPYLPSSPCVDGKAFLTDRRYLPEDHLWGPRDFFKSPYYTHSLCHFVSEIGYHACPSVKSVKRFITKAKLWPPGNDEWLLHGTSPIPGITAWDYRIELMSKQAGEMFGKIADNLADFAWQSQSVQAEANKFFIELFRGAKWRRTGLIWWNLIDGWPQFSDAVVDYYFEKKLAFDFIRRAQQPVIAMVREAKGWIHDLVACNDTRTPVALNFVVRELGVAKPLVKGRRIAAADAVTVLGTLPYFRKHQRFLVIDWKSDDGKIRGRNHYLAGNPPFSPADYRRWIKQAYGTDVTKI
ncbi:MAG: hypothetical protein WC378_07190 [Opitutaceae bacterium]|jgi:beta-mannosidase